MTRTASRDHVRFHGVEQNTDDWHALRLGRITASNAHVLLARGVNAATNLVSDDSAGIWAKRGHDLEPEAIRLYEEIRGMQVTRPGFVTNDNFPGCGYSPDGLCDRLVEVKCFATLNHMAALRDLPFKVYAQVQFGMMIIEWDQTDVVLYNPDIAGESYIKIITVERDDRLIKRFKEKLEQANG